MKEPWEIWRELNLTIEQEKDIRRYYSKKILILMLVNFLIGMSVAL